MYLVWLLVGAVLGAASIWLNRQQAQQLQDRYPNFELWSWAVYLLSAALIYVGFAAFNGASAQWVQIELAGLAAFGFVALLGASRWPLLIGIGWLVHSLWDQALHPGGSPGYVPAWYPPACLGFDLYVGVALVVRFRSGALAISPS